MKPSPTLSSRPPLASALHQVGRSRTNHGRGMERSGRGEGQEEEPGCQPHCHRSVRTVPLHVPKAHILGCSAKPPCSLLKAYVQAPSSVEMGQPRGKFHLKSHSKVSASDGSRNSHVYLTN